MGLYENYLKERSASSSPLEPSATGGLYSRFLAETKKVSPRITKAQEEVKQAQIESDKASSFSGLLKNTLKGAGGTLYNTLGGLLVPGATPEELRDKQLMKDTSSGLLKAAYNTAKQAITHPIQTAKSAVGGATRGVSDELTGIITNLFVPKGEQEATANEIKNTLDKYLGATPQNNIAEGFNIAGHATPYVAAGGILGETGGVLGSRIGGRVGAGADTITGKVIPHAGNAITGQRVGGVLGNVAGFTGVGQASIPTDSTLKERADRATQDLVALGLFEVGSKAFSFTKARILDGMKKNIAIETPPENPPPDAPPKTPVESPVVSKTVPETRVAPKVADPLLTEARKYKSAEEFANKMYVEESLDLTPGSTRLADTSETGLYHGAGITNLKSILSDGKLRAGVSKMDNVGEKTLSASGNRSVANSYGVVFELDSTLPKRIAPKGAIKGDVYDAFEYRIDADIPLSKVKSVTIPLNKGEGLNTQVMWNYTGKTPEYISAKELAAQFEAKRIKVFFNDGSNLTKSQLTDIWKKAQETPTAKAPEPIEVKSDKILKSRVFERMKKENPNLEGELGYSEVNLKKDAEKAVDLITKDKQEAYDIAMGKKTSSEVTSTSVNIALAEKALQEGNHSLYARLIKNRSLEQTRRGQELVAEKGSVSDNSTSRYVKELLATRMDVLGKKYLGDLGSMIKGTSNKQRAVRVIENEVAKVEKTIKNKKLTTKDALSLLEKLICV